MGASWLSFLVYRWVGSRIFVLHASLATQVLRIRVEVGVRVLFRHRQLSVVHSAGDSLRSSAWRAAFPEPQALLRTSFARRRLLVKRGGLPRDLGWSARS